ncbi:uncharacterized protein E6C27_scaffold82G005550 [Cucumis melo var. makuwa]|uniref:Uncharacterized protein n=2 Tax=Cucumis melo TaxID=3656 RepID=A0A5A7VDR7_CUCMM|nr:uncharacterized protein LOC127148704 [Cucumis melo]KAA0065217.1 uncharacterized protein E6C27_scaffold82G005550 [Cucumis melo var. makuwa]
MVLNGFDSVKALKAISIGNYSRRRKLKWLFEFFVFLFLVSNRSSFFSLAGPILHHFFQRILAVLNSHIFVFMVFHAMLFVVYSLSHLTDNKSGSNRTEPDSSESLVAPPVDVSVEEKSTEEMPVIEDSIAEAPAEETTELVITAVDDTAVLPPSSPVRHLNAEMEAAEIIPEEKRYRRTESERFEENREKSKFRRSKTEIRWRNTTAELTGFVDLVDEMDIDDFNRTVESFIAEQKMHIGGRVSG